MTKLESGVTELIINKPESFKYIPRQYCRIFIDSLSNFQFHPFTLLLFKTLLQIPIKEIGLMKL